MKLGFSRFSRVTCCAIVLGWLIFEGCGCDKTKEETFPGFWVTCIGNQPALMTYSGDTPIAVSQSPAGSFDPKDWDCTSPNSPSYKGSQASAFVPSSPSGPAELKPSPRDVTGQGNAYLPQILRDLPFIPPFSPAVAQRCDPNSPDVLRAIHTKAEVTRISTCPFAVKAIIPVPTRPLQVAVTPDGSYAVVTSFDNAISFINLTTNKVTFTLTTDASINPHGLAISNDGTRAYVTSFVPSTPQVLVLDISNLSAPKILTSIRLPSTAVYPQGATLSPDNSQLWITSPLAFTVIVIDTLSNTIAAGLDIAQAVDVAFNATGTTAYVTSQSGSPGSVTAVATDSLQVGSSFKVGNAPTDIVMSYGDQFLIVNNDGDGSVSVIDLVQNAVKAAQVGSHPTGIAMVR
jgi:DNA-binding beta-propeller fold protein YncE